MIPGPCSARAAGLVEEERQRALAERAPNAELDHHHHHLNGGAAGGRANRRDGQGRKTLLTASGKLPILAPRGHFPWDEAALKLLVLVLNLADRGGLARAPGAIRFEERCQTA